MPASEAADPAHMYLTAFGYMIPNQTAALMLMAAFVVVSQLKINVMNAYAGSLAWSNFFSRLTHSHPGRVVWLVFNVAIALLLMQLGIYRLLEASLSVFSIVAMAWLSTISADLFINKPLGLSPPGIEFKRARQSALEGLVPENDFVAGDKGDRIAHGQRVHLAQGDVFYGSVEIDEMSFMSRERAPFRDDIDLDDLSKSSWRDYAHACGQALAQAHARSDDAGELDYRIEPRIIEAMQPFDLFVDDLLCFGREAVKRLKRDHKFFKMDLKRGAFDMRQKHYR